MTQKSLVWSGSAIGDATDAPYSDDEFTDMMSELLAYDRTVQGVVDTAKTGYTGLLGVSCPAGTTARVANGIAFVDGKLYRNTANVDFTVAVPATGNNWYTVVLQKDFALQTVRLVLLEAGGNSDGGASTAAAAPAVTQIDGTTWEISLAQLLVDSGGADADSIIDTRDYVIASVTPIYRRQGGSATIWAQNGTTDYTPSCTSLVQCGVITIAKPGLTTVGSQVVTFPVAFSYEPIVICSMTNNALGAGDPQLFRFTNSGTISPEGFTAYLMCDTVNEESFDIAWLAIGPR